MEKRRKRDPIFFISAAFIAGAFLLIAGMIGSGQFKKSALKAEIRLKLYNEAIDYYEKARALWAEGQADKALEALRKAVRVVSDFPEAYDLRRQIYLALGDKARAKEEEALFRAYGGERGISLYRLREKTLQEVEYRKKHSPPPDIQPSVAYALSTGVALACILGMIYEYRRLTRPGKEDLLVQKVILEKFPSDEEVDMNASWFFKGCALLLPAPFFFSLLVFLGLHHYSNLLPVFFFSWTLSALAVYLIFFADLRSLGDGLRGRKGMS